MSTNLQVKSKPEEVPSDSESAGPRDHALEEDISSRPLINNVESLKQGIIKTFKNDVQAPYTILLVGETGVGKSAFMEFITNVIIGNSINQYDFRILDRANEQGGSGSQSQTNSARFYEFKSKSGLLVRILDTPGLADTRGIQQDEVHKRSIANEIQNRIDSVNAVLILANGTVPRITVGTDYTLSTLSAIFPKTLADNIAFVFTNVLNPLTSNFSQDTVPQVLKDAPQFHLDNPVALQKKYIELASRGDQSKKKNLKADMRKHVVAGEQKALQMMVKLFDWLDCLEPQPTAEIVRLYEMSQDIEAKITNTLAQADQAAARTGEINQLMLNLKQTSEDVNAFAHFERTVNQVVWRQRRTPTNNMVCGEAECYANCYIDYKTNIPLSLRNFFGRSCHQCKHRLQSHHRCRAIWEQLTDTQVAVDQDMKKKWETARNGKEKTAALVEASEKILKDLNRVIGRATNELEQLAGKYAELALSGSFSAQVGSAVRLLEQNYAVLEKKEVGAEQLQRVKQSLDHMQRKQNLLNKKESSIGSQRTFG